MGIFSSWLRLHIIWALGNKCAVALFLGWLQYPYVSEELFQCIKATFVSLVQPMVTGHSTGWAAFDSSSLLIVVLLSATLWEGKELGWWIACPCLMTKASWGVPAAFYPCLTCRDVPAGPWRGVLATLEAVTQAPIVLQLQKQRPPEELAQFQVSWGLWWMLEAVQFGWG